jgi:hypothetical protein
MMILRDREFRHLFSKVGAPECAARSPWKTANGSRTIGSLILLASVAAWSPKIIAGGAGHPDDISHWFAEYAELLAHHVIEYDLEGGGLLSAFDYHAALSRDDTFAMISAQRERLANVDIAKLDTREKFNAFWLNAYNFFMIAHLLEERPGGELVNSVWDYGGRFNPFRANVFERGVVRRRRSQVQPRRNRSADHVRQRF